MTMDSRSARPRSRTVLCTAIAAALAGAAGASFTIGAAPAGGARPAARAGIDVPVPQPILTSNELIGEAKADECFIDIGVDYPPINPDGTCPEGTPKTNESYIWGLTEESNKLYFGTIANAACIISGQPQLAEGGDPAPGFVCEFGESQPAREHPAIPDAVGDWRVPSIYQYDLATDELRAVTPSDPLMRSTLGFRGAGSIDNIAFLAGQALGGPVSNFFAYKADTGEFLGSCEMTNYNYVRKWETTGGVLYVGVGSRAGGAVLRWDGDLSSFDGNFCDDFTVVGHLTAYTANLAVYHGGDGEDHLAATTVPISNGTGVGLWVSPPLGPDGLTPEDADNWHQVWSPKQYDPDPIVAQFGYSGGAVIDFDGWVYWGTIHLSNSRAKTVHMSCTFPICFGPPQTPEEEEELATSIHRTGSVWRGRNLESPDREIQLLYGESELPVVNPQTGHFEPKSTGWTPLYGHSGFDNENNEYIWQMAVFNGHLFVGTYDASIFQQTPDAGGDLWRFDSSDSPAVNEDYQGLGDRFNYGIRAMDALDDSSALVVGMANPFNLRPGGGWELRRLKESP